MAVEPVKDYGCAIVHLPCRCKAHRCENSVVLPLGLCGRCGRECVQPDYERREMFLDIAVQLKEPEKGEAG